MGEALDIAVRLEAYEEYRAPPIRMSAAQDPKPLRHKEHYSRVVTDDEEQRSSRGDYSDRVDADETIFTQFQKGVKSCLDQLKIVSSASTLSEESRRDDRSSSSSVTTRL